MDTEIIEPIITIEEQPIVSQKQLLIDYCSLFKLDTQLIQESIIKNNGRLLIKSIIQRANRKNANGRYYPKNTLEREMKKYYDIFVKENRAYSELDHPESQIVNVKNSCATLESYWWEGDDVWGEFEILRGTPAGNIVEAILKLGKTLGISSRALGSLTESAGDDVATVNDDLSLISFDIVSNPSTRLAQFSLNENINLSTITESITYNGKYDKVNNLLHDIICDQTCELAKLNKKR
jgi:hypothetical protein